MGAFSDFFSSSGLDPKAVMNASARLEAQSQEGRALVIGLGAGTAGYRAVLDGSRPGVPTALSVAASVGPAPAPAAPEFESPADDDSVAPASPPSSSAARRAPSSALSVERALLDRARARMASGASDAALDSLNQHAQRFPRGLLTEEREAMAVNVLVSLGRSAEARARGRAFRERFPSSLVQRSVDAALATLPSE